MFPLHKLTNSLTWSISLGDERLNSKFTVPGPVKQAWGAGTDRTHPPSLINSVHVRWIKLTHKTLYDNFISNTCPMYILTDQENSSGTTVELESHCILWFHQNSFNISFPGFCCWLDPQNWMLIEVQFLITYYIARIIRHELHIL